MKLLRSTEKQITKDKNGQNVPHFEITEVKLVYCYIVKDDYQQNLRAWYSFVSNKSIDQLLEIPPANFISLKTINWVFSYIAVWFIDQNYKPIELENKKKLDFNH